MADRPRLKVFPGSYLWFMNMLKLPIAANFRVFRILLIFLQVAVTSATAQQHYHFFYGKVFEQGTKSPVANANLSVSGSRVGTVTDKHGAFSFYIDTIPGTLVISYVGFETKTILLDETSYSLTLYLNRKASELHEVEIKASLNEPFFKSEHYAVLDYEIDSNMVYLLIFRDRLSRAELICKNPYGDTVAVSAPFGFTPERLFRDCLSNMHVLGHDSGFQVFRQGNRLHLIHPVKLKKFEDVLKNCVAATPEVLYFQRSTEHGLGVEYYGVNKKTMMKQAIARIRDEKKTKMLRRNADDALLLGSSRPPDSRDDFVTWNYVHKILYRPIKTSLYRIGSYICIFNTPDRQMEFYDSLGNFSYKLALEIDKVKDGRWTNDILVDETSGTVYTTFVRNGTCSLYRIDLNSGALRKRVSLDHDYPEKVRVYNNFAYYLYNIPGDPDNKMLYRQKF
ncbi:MAG: carboxypeptidase-like regulatory domain-containing protein [Bacteroidota bacterium]